MVSPVDSLRLNQRVAVITGASRGIGRAIAVRFAQAGARIVAAATNRELLDQLLGEIRSLGAEGFPLAIDVSVPADAAKLCHEAVERFGRLDILVNNAGITRDGLVLRMKEEDWDRVLDVNLKGAFNCAKAAFPYMMKARWGRIINLSSVSGQTGNAGQANYAASKGGLIALTKALAKEFAPRNVLVNAIAPGYISTDMTKSIDEKARAKLLERIPLSRFGEASEVADVAMFLASDLARYITGQVITVDGGLVM